MAFQGSSGSSALNSPSVWWTRMQLHAAVDVENSKGQVLVGFCMQGAGEAIERERVSLGLYEPAIVLMLMMSGFLMFDTAVLMCCGIDNLLS